MSDKEVIGLLEIIDIYIDGRQIRRSSLGACYIDGVAVGILHIIGCVPSAFDIRFCVLFLKTEILENLYDRIGFFCYYDWSKSCNFHSVLPFFIYF